MHVTKSTALQGIMRGLIVKYKALFFSIILLCVVILSVLHSAPSVVVSVVRTQHQLSVIVTDDCQMYTSINIKFDCNPETPLICNVAQQLDHTDVKLCLYRSVMQHSPVTLHSERLKGPFLAPFCYM